MKVVHKTESVQFLETVKWLEGVVLGGGNVKVVHKTDSVQFLETVKWLEGVVLGRG